MATQIWKIGFLEQLLKQHGPEFTRKKLYATSASFDYGSCDASVDYNNGCTLTITPRIRYDKFDGICELILTKGSDELAIVVYDSCAYSRKWEDQVFFAKNGLTQSDVANYLDAMENIPLSRLRRSNTSSEIHGGRQIATATSLTEKLRSDYFRPVSDKPKLA